MTLKGLMAPDPALLRRRRRFGRELFADVRAAHASALWQHWFGDVAARHPVVITEWGFMDKNRESAPAYLVGSEITYGEPLLAYLDACGIDWIACWYDDEWMPPCLRTAGVAPPNTGDSRCGS